MNRRRALTITAAMLFALPAAPSVFAQQNEAPAAQPSHKLPSVDDHLRMLAEKLDLTADQQEKARPVITEMQAEMQKVYEDKGLTAEEVTARTHAAFMKADKQFREFLTDDQKTKLTELEQQMHSGSHGEHSAAPSAHN
jgi:Spy/CpxP family protein refolding chaperone